MLGSIAVEKEIYACETAQICVGLHIGDLIPLGECSYTSHYIFNSIKYLFLVHDYALLLTIKSLTSISSSSEILTRVSKEGCNFYLAYFFDSIFNLLTEYNTLMLNVKLQIIFEVAI